MRRWREPLAAILLLGLALSVPLRSQTPPQPNVAFTFTFGTYSIYPTALAVDANGNSYMAGTFSFGSDGFPVSADAAQTDRASMWVAKIDSSGSRIVWATYLGGHHNRNTYWRGPLDSPSGISVDPEGNVYVAGHTAASDFPAVNAFINSPPGRGTDGFLVKLNPFGTKILFSTYLGGLDVTTYASAVASDSAGNSYVALHADRSLGFETRDLSDPGTTGGAVLVKLNPAGGVVYATRFGSWQDDDIADLAIDPFGAPHFTGRIGTRHAAFAAAIDPSGSRVVFSTALPGAPRASSVATDSQGATYVSGITTDSSFPTKDAYQPAYGGNGDFFLTKVDRSGSVVFSTFLGGAAAEGYQSQVLVDAADRATVLGTTQSLAFAGSSDVRHPDVPIFKTRDAGRTWTRIVGGLQTSVSALAVTETGPRIWYAGADDGIWRSLDEGESWQRTGGPGFELRVAELAIDPRNPDTVYAGTSSGTYKTNDRGQRWTLVDSAAFSSAWIGTALGVDGNGWVFTGTRGFRRSRNGGGMWEDLNAGLRVGPTGVYEQVYTMAFGAAAGVIYAVQSDGLHHTTDGGESWALVPVQPQGSSGRAHTLALPQGRPHRIFFSTFSLTRSDDDGTTWKSLPMGISTVTRVLVRPGHPDTIFVLNGFRQPYEPTPLFVSVDAGESWTRATTGLPDPLTTMQFDPRDPNVALLAAPIRSLTLALGLDRPAKHARFSGVLEQGTFVRAAQDPSGALYIVMTKDGKPTLVKLRTP